MIKDGVQVVIDFQDARLGTPVYDLVSLMEDCYYQVSDSNREILLKYYYDNYFSVFDSTKTYDDFIYLYDMMAIQRVYKAIGSFAYIYADRKDQRYIKYMGYAFEKIRNIMLKYDSLTKERKILSGVYYAA
jgi:aminoglycoside/choline kinase family phosphotransferase